MTVPIEPSADLRQFAQFLREMHIALLNVGFNEPQASAILGQVVFAGLLGGGTQR
jgi:hypothetical protein